jgi:hypothetical protein
MQVYTEEIQVDAFRTFLAFVYKSNFERFIMRKQEDGKVNPSVLSLSVKD